MAEAVKYQVKAQLYQQGAVTAYQGLDPLTGLPVRLYRFTGKPTLQVGVLESDFIPRVLATGFNGQEGTLATTFHKDLRPVHQVVSQAEAHKLINETAQALEDAAQAGVIHGDLEPKRFFKANRFVLEGFGVPWQEANSDYRPPDAEGVGSYEGDVYAWAMSLKVLTKGFLPEVYEALLESCLDVDPKRRPVARDILLTLKQLAQESPAELPKAKETTSTKGGDVDFGEIDFSVQSPPAQTSSPSVKVQQGPPPSARTSASEREPADSPASSTVAPVSASPVHKGPPPKTIQHHLPKDEPLPVEDEDDLLAVNETQGDFVKAAPPGATYRTVEEKTLPAPKLEMPSTDTAKPQQRNTLTRRTLMVLALFIAAGVLASIPLFFRNDNDGATDNGNGDLQVLEINLSPNNLPFVELIVISSPAGSARRSGDIIATLTPSAQSIILDQPGTWSLRAKYQERYSELVTVNVPEQRSIDVTIPE